MILQIQPGCGEIGFFFTIFLTLEVVCAKRGFDELRHHAQDAVLIEGFYDGIELTDDVRAILAAVPDDEDAILAGMGLSDSEAVGESL